MRDRKDMKGTKYVYCNSYSLILLFIKNILRTFPLLKVCLLYLYDMKTKDIALQILKKKFKTM